MKRYFVILIFLFAQYGLAQTVWRADIPVVEKSDYYHIELDQELIGAGLEYLKIFDEQGNETPYFIQSANPIQEINNFENFHLKSNVIKDSLNILVIDNQILENISRFCIVLQKAEAGKFAAIRGSNDLKQWYIVKQAAEVSKLGQQPEDNTEMLILDFPQGNYRYYEITLWSNQKSPMEVLRVGKIKNSNLYGNFIELDPGRFVQKNDQNDQKTYIRFPDIQYVYYISKIEFAIKNKPDYYRQALLSDSAFYNHERLLLSSRKENIFFINDFLFSSGTYISIDNQNNPPLVIDSVRVYGLCRYACVYLEAGKKYNLVSDRYDPVSSKYDIEYFRDKIPADLAILQVKNLHDYNIPEEVAPGRKLSLIEQPVFLWSIIIVVGAFLVFICVRMIAEMKKK